MNHAIIRVFGSLALAVSLFPRVAADDKSPCTATIAANVITPDAEVVRGLELDSFAAMKGERGLPIASAVLDSGPRRIVVILDRTPEFDERDRRTASQVVSRILRNARPQDSFALITSGKGATRMPFGKTPQAILTRFLQFATAPEPGGRPLRLLDAIGEAAAWLQPSQRGDAILVIDGGDDGLYGGSYRRVLKTLLAGGIRVFSVHLGMIVPDIEAGPPGANDNCYFTGPGGIYCHDYHPSRSRSTSDRSGTLRALSWESGGYMITEMFVLSSSRFNQRFGDFSDLGWEMYGAITDFYLLTVGPVPASRPFSWKLDVSSQVHCNRPYVMVAYPAKLRPCGSKP